MGVWRGGVCVSVRGVECVGVCGCLREVECVGVWRGSVWVCEGGGVCGCVRRVECVGEGYIKTTGTEMECLLITSRKEQKIRSIPSSH